MQVSSGMLHSVILLLFDDLNVRELNKVHNVDDTCIVHVNSWTIVLQMKIVVNYFPNSRNV